MIQMVYPERRMVSENTVIGWAQDELVNAVVAYKVYENDEDMDVDIARVHASDEYVSMSLEDAKYILEDAGACAFGR
jgi:hypothetical protein